MSTDAWRTVWHPLRGKTSCWSFCMSVFFSLKFYTVRAQERGLRKKRAVGLSFFVVRKGKKKCVASIRSLLYYSMLREKTSLMVTLTQQLEKSWSKTIKYEVTVPAHFVKLAKKNNNFVFSPPKKTLILKKKPAELKEVLIFSQFLLEMLLLHYTCFLKSYKSTRIRKECKNILEKLTQCHESRMKYIFCGGGLARQTCLWTQGLSSSAGKGRTSNKFLDPLLHKHPDAFTLDTLGTGAKDLMCQRLKHGL